ncbi:beta-galactosidase 17 [Tanacetum coccineum]|uniref:beta-galactosidase n=1 Tax=Tanacetum coccineum TaxID=301880 RepID=A0ABQ5J807_9ASTR
MGFPGPRTRGDMSLTFKRCGNFDPFIAKTDATSTTSALEKILSINGSVVLYMAHCGTNFGYITVQDYPVDLMSYDYDAPISESGDVDGAKFEDSDLSTEATESENSISMEAAGQMFRFLLYASEYTSKGNGNTLSIPKWIVNSGKNNVYFHMSLVSSL